MSNEIYSMKLHERLDDGKYNMQIIRVPGGWIYHNYIENGTGGYDMCSTFVPFNNEFMGKDENE